MADAGDVADGDAGGVVDNVQQAAGVFGLTPSKGALSTNNGGELSLKKEPTIELLSFSFSFLCFRLFARRRGAAALSILAPAEQQAA